MRFLLFTLIFSAVLTGCGGMQKGIPPLYTGTPPVVDLIPTIDPTVVQVFAAPTATGSAAPVESTSPVAQSSLPTPTPTPHSVWIPANPLVVCASSAELIRCNDILLQMRFDYPAFMGEIDHTELRAGGYAGYGYEYWMAENDAGSAMGGRSRDFSEGRGGMYTDQKGFDGQAAVEICASWGAELCQEIQPGVILMGMFPEAYWFCGDHIIRTTTPRLLIAVNLPNHPLIHGFGFSASLLPLDTTTAPEGGPGTPEFCAPDVQAEYDASMGELRQNLLAGNASEEIQARYNAFIHLAESIEGPYVGRGDE